MHYISKSDKILKIAINISFFMYFCISLYYLYLKSDIIIIPAGINITVQYIVPFLMSIANRKIFVESLKNHTQKFLIYIILYTMFIIYIYYYTFIFYTLSFRLLILVTMRYKECLHLSSKIFLLCKYYRWKGIYFLEYQPQKCKD